MARFACFVISKHTTPFGQEVFSVTYMGRNLQNGGVISGLDSLGMAMRRIEELAHSGMDSIEGDWGLKRYHIWGKKKKKKPPLIIEEERD